MAENKKEMERAELHRTIWAIADEMRGAVDGWDFKSYILGMLFYRYISENITNYINKGEWDTGNTDFDYATLDDDMAESIREEMVGVKGFFILPSQLFCNICKVCDKDANLNETLEKIFTSIEASAKGTESEDDFKGLFADLDVNSNKLGATVIKRNEKLVKLLRGIQQMNLGDYQDNTIDAFGDAYEYLMGMYASNAGKSGGEYYTPQEVSELLTRLATLGKTEVNKVYDPACGSGSLLLKAAKILGKDNVRQGFYGQEINLTTYNLCRINMFLHDIDYDKFNIACEDTLLSPQHWDEEPFEVIVSNPPYSIKWKGDDDITLINDPRYAPAGVLAPKSKADLAFIMHSLAWLATNGTASIVCFPGIMYRGGAEKKIRQYLIDNNYVDCVIQLPDNLFFGTSIATCIMVLKKSKNDNSTLFIDASRECVKITNNNKLTPENIQHIVDYFAERKDVDYTCKLVANNVVAENDYNLSVSTYVEQEDTREKVDIVKLNKEIAEIVARENVLRAEIDKIIADFYRDNLLTNLEDYEEYSISDISSYRRGSFPQPYTNPNFYGGEDAMPFVQVADIANEGFLLNRTTNQTISKMAQPKSVFVPKGTVICSLQGSIGRVAITQYDAYIDRTIAIFTSIDPKVDKQYFAFQLSRIFSIAKEKARGGTIKTITKEEFSEFKIQVPSLNKQREIVAILDRFDTLTTDITAGLPAEIEARRKQYEYYRDQLLTFKQKA